MEAGTMTRSALVFLLAPAVALAAARPAAAQTTPPTPPPPQQPRAAAPAAVPPAVPPASQPPPAGGDGRDMSHIGGVPVRVGDHHEYYYGFRRTNLSTNPIGWILGIYGVSLSYGLSSHFALRGDVNYFNPVGDDGTEGYELGVGLPIYFRRTYSGPFLEPGAIVRRFTDSGLDEEGDDDNITMGPQVLAGWHWIWDSGLNLALAFGLGRNWSERDTDSDYDDEEVFVNGYLRFGYAF
jgi:Protein of unknown function (DUF3575)